VAQVVKKTDGRTIDGQIPAEQALKPSLRFSLFNDFLRVDGRIPAEQGLKPYRPVQVDPLRSISAQATKGGFSSALGNVRPRLGKVPFRRPLWTPQFQTARKLAIFFVSVVGLKGLPRYCFWAHRLICRCRSSRVSSWTWNRSPRVSARYRRCFLTVSREFSSIAPEE
jgi:hypothetical protein